MDSIGSSYRTGKHQDPSGSSSQSHSHSDYTIGFICASEEQAAVCPVLDHIHPSVRKHDVDNNTYALGSILEHNVVIAWSTKRPAPGAGVAVEMLATFPAIRFVILIGTGKGNSPYVQPGDVVVGTPYGGNPALFRLETSKDGKGEWNGTKSSLKDPPNILLKALETVSGSWTRIENELRGSTSPAKPVGDSSLSPLQGQRRRARSITDVSERDRGLDVNSIGLPADVGRNLNDAVYEGHKIASGRDMNLQAGVILSIARGLKNTVFSENSDALGFNPLWVDEGLPEIPSNLPCMTIRIICDSAGNIRRTIWDNGPAMIAAAVARELLRNTKPSNVAKEPPVRNWAMENLGPKSTSVYGKVLACLGRDYDFEQKTYLRRYIPGTCAWFLRSPDWNTFHRDRYRFDDKNRLLSCVGGTGAGKSTLASLAVDTLKTQYGADEKTVITYVYCDYACQGEQSLTHLVGSLLRQLIRKLWQIHGGIPVSIHLNSLYRYVIKGGSPPTSEELIKYLQTVAEEYSKVFIVIDGLNERNTRHWQNLISSLNQTKSRFKILITLRHTLESFEVPETFSTASLNVRARFEDVVIYFDKRLPSLNHLNIVVDPQLQEDIVSVVFSHVDGCNPDPLKAIYNYAAQYWAYHAQLSIDGDDSILKLLRNREKLISCLKAFPPLRHSGGSAEAIPERVSELHLATYFGLCKSLEILLQEGAELEASDSDGSTPLSWAAKYGNAAAAQVLIDHEADLETMNNDGYTPFNQIAQRANPKPMVQDPQFWTKTLDMDDSGQDEDDGGDNGMEIDEQPLTIKDFDLILTFLMRYFPDPNGGNALTMEAFDPNPRQKLKSNIYAFIYPPRTIPAAMAIDLAFKFADANVLTNLLAKQFEQVATDEYSWIIELDDAGYSSTEIAEILIQDAADTPWIYFEPRYFNLWPLGSFVEDEYHAPGCVHQCLNDPLDQEKACGTPDYQNSSLDLGEIQELCGLAGITPEKNTEVDLLGHITPSSCYSYIKTPSCNGVVEFKNENSVAVVSYSDSVSPARPTASVSLDNDRLILQRITSALSRLCAAAGRLQSSGLCCNAFTVLVHSSSSQTPDLNAGAQASVSLHRIRFDMVEQLLNVLRSNSIYTLALQAGYHLIREAFLKIFDSIELLFVENISKRKEKFHNLDETLSILSLATQFLTIGFLSYVQGHVGPIQPFFLDTPQRKVVLTGSGDSCVSRFGSETSEKSDPPIQCITLGLTDLTCLGNMTRGAVLAFREHRSLADALSFDEDGKFDVLATAEDILDTWGPGNFVIQSSPTLGKFPCAIRLRDGLIYATSNEANTSLHWSDAVDIHRLQPIPFHPRAILLIGSPVEINSTCTIDENECWQKSHCAFENLDVHKHYWEHNETQGGYQAGNYFLVQANWTKHKIPGSTFKQEILEQDPKMLVRYLNCLCGLQVSFCTGVARRVTLRELIADLFPVFTPIWILDDAIRDELENHHNIPEAFRTATVQDHLKRLPKHLHTQVLTVIWNIVSCLRHTGIDPEGKFLSAAWLRAQDDGPPRCLRISCNDRKNSWVHVLADSEDCATFAYISTNCLVTPEVPCRGPSPLWHNTTPLLETAVLQHNENPSQPLSQLDNKRVYFFRKMDNLLRVSVDRQAASSSVTLLVGQSSIPPRFARRFYVMEKHRWIRIREKQRSSEDGVEQVTVLAKDGTTIQSLLSSRPLSPTVQTPTHPGPTTTALPTIGP
ncbi:hypothetical protein ABW21_db0209022 [Orbilia brochopaga]|nr:hypothetical protein ABW21_db0209022 [Drechslerella brochopaga]